MSNFKIANKPEKIPELFVEYWNMRSADGIAYLFVQNAEFVNVVGLWWHDKEAIRKAHDYGLKVIFNQSELKLLRVKTTPVENNVAVVHAKMKLTKQTAHAKVENPRERRNIFTFVTQKFKNGWKCLAAHNTDIVPGKETNVVGEEGLKAVDYRLKKQ